MAKGNRTVTVVLLAFVLGLLFAPAGAWACEIDGFPAGFVPNPGGEQLGYAAPGNVPGGEDPGVTPIEYAPASPGGSTGIGMMLVLGVALLAAPLFATLTVVAARMNQRR